MRCLLTESWLPFISKILRRANLSYKRWGNNDDQQTRKSNVCLHVDNRMEGLELMSKVICLEICFMLDKWSHSGIRIISYVTWVSALWQENSVSLLFHSLVLFTTKCWCFSYGKGEKKIKAINGELEMLWPWHCIADHYRLSQSRADSGLCRA